VDAQSPTPDAVGTLSIHRAFVVRLYADVEVASGRLQGQVEHLVSGEGSEFRSVEDLLRFIGRVLDAHQPEGLHVHEDHKRDTPS
jgi:hypothetical protein